MVATLRICSVFVLALSFGCSADGSDSSDTSSNETKPSRNNHGKDAGSTKSESASGDPQSVATASESDGDGGASTLPADPNGTDDADNADVTDSAVNTDDNADLTDETDDTDANDNTDASDRTEDPDQSDGSESETDTTASEDLQSTSSTSSNVDSDGEDGTDDPSLTDTNGYCGVVGTATLVDAAGDPKVPAEALTEEQVEGSACNATIRTYPTKTSHVTPCTDVEYDTNPPASGMHYPVYPRYGVYSTPVPRGFWVHSLEHGGVVITYACSDCESEIAEATSLVSTLPVDEGCCVEGDCPADATNRMLLTPDPGIDTRWAAAAWGKTLTADCFEPDVFEKFAQESRGFSIETICSNSGARDLSKPAN